MRIVFDQGVPKPLRAHLRGHFIQTSQELGWPRLTNGKLLSAAEEAGFDLLITTDKNLSYQQNLSDRRIAVRVLSIQQWPALRPHVSLVVDAVDSVLPGSFAVIEIPSD
jgi:hypothetical protein